MPLNGMAFVVPASRRTLFINASVIAPTPGDSCSSNVSLSVLVGCWTTFLFSTYRAKSL